MKLTHLLLCIPGLLAGISTRSSAALRPDSVAVPIQKVVKIGPPELGVLVDPEVLVMQALDERIYKKNQEQSEFNRLLDYQQLYSSFNELKFSVLNNDSVARLSGLVPVGKSRNSEMNAVALNSLGVFYSKNGDLNKSTAYFKESLKIYQALDNKPEQVKLGQILADSYRILKKYDTAAACTEQNVKVLSALQRPNEVAAAYISLAQLKVLQSKHQDAEYYILRKAFPLFRRMGNKVGRMKCFESLALMYKSQNRLTEAKWFFIQENMMANKLENVAAKISSLISIATVKNEIGETDLALLSYKEAEQLASQFSLIPKLIEIKGNVGEIYRKIGNYSAAGTALDEYNKLKSSLTDGLSSKAF